MNASANYVGSCAAAGCKGLGDTSKLWSLERRFDLVSLLLRPAGISLLSHVAMIPFAARLLLLSTLALEFDPLLIASRPHVALHGRLRLTKVALVAAIDGLVTLLELLPKRLGELSRRNRKLRR